MHRLGPADLGASCWHVAFAPADSAGGGGYNAIFGSGGDSDRAAQLAASWGALLIDLRRPVETVLRGGMSAGDIAYHLGELAHGFYRTRGVTLASYELRRVVIALLDCHRRGWPDATAVADPIGAAAASARSVPASDALVAFVHGDPRWPRAVTWNSDAPSPPPVAVDVPSVLVSRDEPAQGQPATALETGRSERTVPQSVSPAATDPSMTAGGSDVQQHCDADADAPPQASL